MPDVNECNNECMTETHELVCPPHSNSANFTLVDEIFYSIFYSIQVCQRPYRFFSQLSNSTIYPRAKKIHRSTPGAQDRYSKIKILH